MHLLGREAPREESIVPIKAIIDGEVSELGGQLQDSPLSGNSPSSQFHCLTVLCKSMDGLGLSHVCAGEVCYVDKLYPRLPTSGVVYYSTEIIYNSLGYAEQCVGIYCTFVNKYVSMFLSGQRWR